MLYSIKEKLISHNRSHKRLKPLGIVVHSTATPGATDEAEQRYFDRANRKASAHYFGDWDSITRTIPENEQAWHAGPTANSRFLSYEMCEPAGTDFKKFIEVWNRAVWFVADCCIRYGWGIDHIYSHDIVSKTWHETTHSDPIPFLSKYSRTWSGFKQAVSREMANIELAKKVVKPAPAPKPTPKPVTREEFANAMFDKVLPVIFFGPKLDPQAAIKREEVQILIDRAYQYEGKKIPKVIRDGRMKAPLLEHELKYVLRRLT